MLVVLYPLSLEGTGSCRYDIRDPETERPCRTRGKYQVGLIEALHLKDPVGCVLINEHEHRERPQYFLKQLSGKYKCFPGRLYRPKVKYLDEQAP